MRRALIIALIGAASLAATPAFAAHGHGTTTPPTSTHTTNSNNGNGNGGGSTAPTLHGFCSLTAPCMDAGSNTPTTQNAPTFGFATSGAAATGPVLIDILVPNNTDPHPSSVTYTISGPLLGTQTDIASLVSTTPWSRGQLDSYLAIVGGASPTNPIGNYLPATQTYQPGATGFYVYQANIGTVTLPGNSTVGTAAENAYLMHLNQGVPQGSFILAFIDPPATDGATANSGALFITSPPLPEPATWAMMLIGFGAIGFSMRRNRRNSNTPPQVA